MVAWSGGVEPFAAGFDANQPDRSVGQKFGEHAHRIGAAADAGGNHVGQLVLKRHELSPCLVANDALEVAHHLRAHAIGVQVIQFFLEGGGFAHLS